MKNLNSDHVKELEKVSLSLFFPLPEKNIQYSIDYIDSNSVIKLKESDSEILIGVCENSPSRIKEDLAHFHYNKKIKFYRIDKSELTGYLGKTLSGESSDDKSGGIVNNDKITLNKLANDAPIVNLVNSIFIDGIRMGASDIHIESFNEDVIVRFRIDSVLKTVSKIEKNRFPAVASRIKIMANLNIMEKRLPQDGRISVHIDDDKVDMRVSIVPISGGESIVLRVFNKSRHPLTLEQLGFDKHIIDEIIKISRTPHGLFLITGPTGSGKTTTLNSLLREIKSDSQKIIAIEDPVEYLIEGIDQIQTNEEIGLSFDTILRRVLRQDPDIIMVGEIRDRQTADLAVRSALTGHLVLSTLHTNDSVSVISRMKNMGIEPYLIAAVLRGSAAQRLVRKICPECREKRVPKEIEKRVLIKHGLDLGFCYYGKGCSYCNNTGYKGRTGIIEFIASTEELETMIVRDEPLSVLRNYLSEKGYKKLIENGLDKVVKGITTIEEIERAVAI